MIIQLTGLSGAGKTAIARYLKRTLARQNLKVEVIDGDQYRKTLCKDLGFSKKDRYENIRRLGGVANIIRDMDVAIISAINPYEEARKELKDRYKAKTIWVNCDLEVLIKRDPKGLYRRSMLPDTHPDKIYNLTGIDDVYENPQNADFIVYTDRETLKESSQKIADFIREALSYRDSPMSRQNIPD